METPKFIQIQVNQSYLFGLTADGEVYQMVDLTETATGSILAYVVKKRVWKKVTELEFINGEWK